MCFSLKKIFFPLFGLELLRKEVYKLFVQGAQYAKESVRKELFVLLRKALVVLLVLGLFFVTLLLLLAALALYLNEVLGSGYQGFLVVAGGCVGVVLLLLAYLAVRWR